MRLETVEHFSSNVLLINKLHNALVVAVFEKFELFLTPLMCAYSFLFACPRLSLRVARIPRISLALREFTTSSPTV